MDEQKLDATAQAPPYQLLPPLSEEEYAALKDDIAANGVRVPVDVDADGNILDGHHRARIAAELGIPCPTRLVDGLTGEQKREHALVVNLQRRVLTREQRRALIAAELRHDPTRSDRRIGRRLGVDGKTVGSVRRELAEAARLEAEEAEADLRRRVDEATSRVVASAGRDHAAWGAWIAWHDRDLGRKVMEHGVALLSHLAGEVCRRFGCDDLDCQHVPPRRDAAELPHLPDPPLRHLGPYRVHPTVDLFPLVDGDQFARMVASIRQHGLLDPIVVTHDRTTLVDGRIRWLACEAAGVEPTVRELPADWSEDRTVRFILSVNLVRVHLTPGQVAAAEVLAAGIAAGN